MIPGAIGLYHPDHWPDRAADLFRPRGDRPVTETEGTAPDTERTDDAAFTGDAADELGAATELETEETAAEEDGSGPHEPQPEAYPDPADETPADSGDGAA